MELKYIKFRDLVERGHDSSKLSHTFHDIFIYLTNKVTFRDQPTKPNNPWTCDGALTLTKQFCDENGMNFNFVQERLLAVGTTCDCGLLLNAVVLNTNEILPLPRRKISVKSVAMGTGDLITEITIINKSIIVPFKNNPTDIR